MVRELVATADVMIQNFRPGVMERIGLDHESVTKINPTIVYGSVSGYGDAGPFKDRPGQDLLAQAISGLPWLNGSRDDPPVPVGLSVADHLASCHLAQGITALLVRRYRTGRGGLVQTSLFESLLDLQFELLTTRLNDPTDRGAAQGPALGARLPARAVRHLPLLRRLPRHRDEPRPDHRAPARPARAGLDDRPERPGGSGRRRSRSSSPTGCGPGPATPGSRCSTPRTSGARRC